MLTDTVEHSDGIQRCIRVRLKPGRRERRDVDGRGRNRKGTGSSGWRDDKPFDSRGSIIWPDHLGKFIRLCHLFSFMPNYYCARSSLFCSCKNAKHCTVDLQYVIHIPGFIFTRRTRTPKRH